MASRAVAFGRLLLQLPGFLRHPVTVAEAGRIIGEQLDRRGDNFLDSMEQLVFANPRSPYLPMLRAAGCELGDIREAVRRSGVEEMLSSLRRAGVYVAFEEFKGRAPIVRGGEVIDARPEDFDNPVLRGGLRSSSGGSTGEGTRVWLSLDYLADRARSMLLGYEAYGILGAPSASLRESLPAPSLGIVLEDAYSGQPHERWFAPSHDTAPFSLRRHRLAQRLVEAAARVGGARLPHPEGVDIGRPTAVVRWASERGRCMIRTSPSYALRVCLQAHDEGVDLTGTVFVGAGEPVTPGKVQAITRTGARWVSNYAVSELGRVGIGCAAPADATDVHFLEHVAALVRFPREVAGSTVDAFHFTTLLPSAPKVMLNVETDDFGMVERRSCGCPLEAMGFPRHLREIFSFSKLTGEGVTLLGSEALRLIDEVLPGRFGGSPADYQFVEEEDERGLTRLTVVVSPRVRLGSERALVEVLLDGLGTTSAGSAIRAMWRAAGTVDVRRDEPEVTRRGKLRPIVVRRGNKPTRP